MSESQGLTPDSPRRGAIDGLNRESTAFPVCRVGLYDPIDPIGDDALAGSPRRGAGSFAPRFIRQTEGMSAVAAAEQLLQMLADEVSVEALREVGDQSPVALAHALRARAFIADLRAREFELSALNDSAIDLAAKVTVREVLEAITRRARALLDAHASYLTLLEKVGDLSGSAFTRVTSGIAGDDFREVHALGLGRLVLDSGAPQFTSDYFADERFTHDDRVDEVVAHAGIAAVLAVPVQIRGALLGVLSVAYRTRRGFTRHDIELVSALASLAAAALQNARLLEDLRRAVEDAETARAEAQERAAQLEHTAAVHESLTELAVTADLDRIAAATAEWTCGAIMILDHRGAELAAADGLGAESEAAEVTEALIIAGERRLGTLRFRGDVLDPIRRQSLERAAQVIALVLLNRQAGRDAEHRRRQELIEHLARHGPGDACRRAERLGIDTSKPYRLTVIDARDFAPGDLSDIGEALSRPRGLIAADVDAVVVVLISQDVPVARLSEVGVDLAEVTSTVTAATSDPITRADAFAGALADARAALDLLLALGRTGDVVDVHDLGFYGFVFRGASRAELARFVDETLGALIRHDQRHRTELVATVEVIFGHGNQLSAAADALHVHINTLYRRVERIGALLGADWRGGDAALRLQFALRLRQWARPDQTTSSPA